MKENNAYFAFHNVDFLFTNIDKNQNIHLYMFDTYDFNKNESPKIEAGRRKMSKGNSRGFLQFMK